MHRQSETSDLQEVAFFYKPKGNEVRVFVVGEFNGWQPAACPMYRRDGHFEASVKLPAGQYAYRFLVDGKLLNDPTGEMQVWRGPGGVTSVVRVGARRGTAVPA